MAEEEQVAVSAEEQPVASSDDWKAVIDDEGLRGDKALEPIQSVENLAKAYVNASSMIGRDKIPLPGEHSSAEDWGEVYDRLGRPESADAYALEAGEEPDENLLGWFKNTAHEIGLNNTQAQKLMVAYNDLAAGQEEEAPDLEGIRAQVTADLRKEYGNAYDDRMSLANGMLSQLGNDELTEIQLADGSLLGDSPEFIKSMVGIGEYIRDKVSEDDFAGFEKSNTAMTPAEAQDKLREIEAPNGPLFDGKHPQHDFFVQERNRLYENIYGTDPVA